MRISPLAAAAFLVLAPAAFGVGPDNWINPAGGSWTDNGNWSLGSPSSTAFFNLASTSGYTVTVPSTQFVVDMNVQTDNTTINLNGNTFGTSASGSASTLDVGSSSGQNGSLTVFSSVAGAQFLTSRHIWIASSGTFGGIGSATFDNIDITCNSTVNIGVSVGQGTGCVGSLTLKDGAQLNDTTGVNPTVFLGGILGSPGTGTMSMDDATAMVGHLDVGGNSSLTLTNHSIFDISIPTGSLFLGGTVAGGAAINVDNSNLISSSGAMNVQNGGTLTATDDAQVIAGGGVVVGAAASGISGTAKIKASGAGTIINSQGVLDVGDSGTTGTATFSAGAELEMAGNAYVGGNGGTGSIQLSGPGTLWASPSLPIGLSAVIGANSSGQAGTGTIQLDTGAAWTMPGTITVDAGGTLNVLSGANLTVFNLDLSHGGATNFTGGTITLTGGTLTSSSFSLPNTSTLSGAGTLTGDLTNFGSVSPGDAPGTLIISGDYIQGANGTLEIGLDGTIPGTQYDQLLITGSAYFAGTLDVTLLPGFDPVDGDSFDLFTDSSESGIFTTIELPPLDPGLAWNITNLYTTGTITVVPEPVVALPMLALGLICRRRRSGLPPQSKLHG